MAPTAPQITRPVLTIVATMAIALSCLSQGGLGQETLLPMTEPGTPQVPDREHLPLGSPSTTVEGEPRQGGGYLPDVMEFARVGGALVLVVGLLLGVRVMLRRIGGLPSTRRPSGVIQVHARYPVARGQQIVLLQVGRRIIVAHQGGGGMRTLSEITDPAEVADLRGLLDPGGHQGGRSTDDFQQAMAMDTGFSPGEVVDLTRPGNRRGKPAAQRFRRPGWRGAS